MKTIFKISILFGFLFAESVFAQVFPGFPMGPVVEKPKICIGTFSAETVVNGYNAKSGDVWVSQDKDFCDSVEVGAQNRLTPFYDLSNHSHVLSESKEMSSLSETAETLSLLLKKYWLEAGISLFGKDRLDLYFLSDFDFGQYDPLSEDKSCIKNHTPLQYRTGAGTVNGADYTVRNLCYSGNAKDMTGPLGLFGEVDDGSVLHLNIANVNFTVKVSETDKAKIRPVGALVGRTSKSLYSADSIADITINAPYAGAFAGIILNTTVKGLRGDDDILVYNTSNVGEKATFDSLSWISEGKVFLGGVAALASDVNFENISFVAKIHDSSEVKSSSIGGLTGIGVVGQFKDSDETLTVKGAEFFKKNERTYTKIMGGKYMGGFYGRILTFKNAYDAKKVKELEIDSSSFYGSIFHADGKDSIFAGGMVGFSGLDKDCLLKISNSQTDVRIKDSLTNTSENYYAGGFVGLGLEALGEGEEDSHIMISTSKAAGEIYINRVGENVSEVALGGFVGKGVLTSVSAALTSDTSSMNIKSDVNGEGVSPSDISVGGFVGRVSKVGQNKKMEMESLVFNGSVTAVSAGNDVHLGGIVGISDDDTKDVFTTIKKLEIYGDNLVTLKDSSAQVSTGSAYVGGICGLCNSVDTLYQSAINGNIAVKGAFNGVPLQVGGWFGSVNAVRGLGYKVNYFIGDVLLDSRIDKSKVEAGFFFGEGKIENNKKNVDVKSNYHYGNDLTMDFFGSLWASASNDKTDSWKDLSNNDLKWNFEYNYSNGAVASMSDFNNGLQTETFMKSVNLEKALDAKKTPVEKEWAWKDGVNGNLPFFKGFESSGVVKFIPAPIIPESSSSEEDSSSSEECSSSSEEIESSSEEPVVSSSGAEDSSSSEDIDSSSSDIFVSSSEEPVECSSSDEFVVSSSTEPVNSSSSEFIPESSSEMESVSSSAEIVVKAPKFGNVAFKQSGNAVKIFLSAKVPSVEVKTVAKLDILRDDESVLKTVVIADSIDKVEAELEKVIAPVPYGKFNVKVTLDNGFFENYVTRELDVDNSVQVNAWSWQMVSVAGYDYATLSRDEGSSFFWWDETREFGEYWQYHAYSGNEIDVNASGVWYGSLDARTIALKSDVTAEVKDVVWYVDSIYSGWNLVSNPYGWAIALSVLDNIDVKFWNWNPDSSSYGIPKVLRPYEAMWVKVNRPMTLRIPSDPVFEENANAVMAKKSAFSKVEGGWALRAKLSDHFGKSDSWNVIGAGQSEFSEEPPHGMGDYVRFTIVSGKKALAKSVMAEKDVMEWTAELSASNNRIGVLEFEGIADVNASGKKVFVTIDDRTTEMREGVPLEVKLSDTPKTAVIRVAAEARPIVEYALKGFLANRSGNMLNVNFEASSSLNGSRLNVQLLNVLGEVISTVKAKTITGMNQVSLKVPQNGLYVVRIQAGKHVLVNNVYVH